MVTVRTSHAQRLLRHAVTDHRAVARVFPPPSMRAVEQAIAAGEQRHRGQLCVAIEAALPPGRVWRRVTPRERALEVFGLLRVWDTEENAGVLLYLLLADRDVEIVADRGIHRVVGDAVWQQVCEGLEAQFRAGRCTDGLVDAVNRISDVLAAAFPREGTVVNELPDRPAVL
jgi:uncharacterized membrane protein